MNNVDAGTQYGYLVVSGANQPEYIPLIVRVDRGMIGASAPMMYTAWEFTDEEREAISTGARLQVVFLGVGPLIPFDVRIEGVIS